MAKKEDNFNYGMIQATLLTELRGILEQYPDDNQILKELIQNAEDAGARKVTFLYDKSHYGTDSRKLHHKDLADYQGPALFAYNDAKFSRNDWKSIRMTQDSIKKDDPMKVGRFGLGFKSIFHMTDLPGILSGDQLGFLDPHEKYFEVDDDAGKSRRTSSYHWKLRDLKTIPCQLEPFRQSLFGKDEDYDTEFPGTIFRFPLRHSNQSSALSSTKYTPEKMEKLFSMFQYEAHSFLLFLNSIEQIEIYEKDSKTDEAKLLLSVHIDEYQRENLRETRRKFKQDISPIVKDQTWLRQACYETFQMETVFQNKENFTEKKTWLITQYFEGGPNSTLQELTENKETKMLPWVGVALQLNCEDKVTPQGQVFCFLPLPVVGQSATGLHFHVHGYFAVDRNRRNLKWPSAEHKLASHLDRDRNWNLKLVEDLLPKAMAKTVKYAIENDFEPEDVYRLFPYPDSKTDHWRSVTKPFYNTIQNERNFYTHEGGGRWLSARNTYMIPQDDESDKGLLRKILLESEYTSNLVQPPSFVLAGMPKAGHPKEVKPWYVFLFLSSYGTDNVTADERRKLVAYFAQTNDDIDNCLTKLELCELEDGTLTTFEKSNLCFFDVGDCGADMKELLPALKNMFHVNVGQEDAKILKKIAKRDTGIQIKGKKQIPDLLKLMFSGCRMPLNLTKSIRFNNEKIPLPETWIDDIWKFIQQNEKNLQRFEDIPLLKSTKWLHCLSKNTPFIRRDRRGTEHIYDILEKIGFVIVEEVHDLALKESYVKDADPLNILLNFRKIENYSSRVEDLESNEKRELRYFLSEASETNLNKRGLDKIMKDLPIVEIIGTLEKRHGEKVEWVCAKDVKYGMTEAPSVSLPPGTRVIDMADERDRRFAKMIRIKELGDSQLFKDLLLRHYDSYPDEEKMKITEFFMHKIEKFDETILKDMMALHSIPTAGGELVKPTEIFNPEDPTLQLLYGDTDLIPFPQKSYRNDLMLAKLKRLGMCGSDALTADDICSLAEHIDNQVSLSVDSDVLKNQGRALAQYLNKNYKILYEVKDFLSQLKFVPVLAESPNSCGKDAPWYKDSFCLVSPGRVSSSYALTGSQVPAPDQQYPSLERTYDWKRTPDLDVVLQHLKCVIESHRKGNEMLPCLIKIYRHLQDQLNENVEILSKLNSLNRWIWVSGGYVYPFQVVFKNDLETDASPFVFECKRKLLEFYTLFKAAGVKQSPNWFDVLKQVESAHQNEKRSKHVARDRRLVMNIIHHFSRSMHKGTDGDLEDLLLPVEAADDRLVLMPRKQCTFCDKEWLKENNLEADLEDLEDNLYIIHSDISHTIAKSLGVPSFMSKYLNADDIDDIGYGPSEPLTTRIKGILEDYKDGLAVLKELIQNADDAGATEVAFIYDCRDFSNDSKGLLDENMQSLQGPAIWTYNNATFTDDDFTNIIKVSGETKKEKTTKIGRFGLGFNAVYHLTDVPCFISRDSIAIFDPHRTYLNNCIKSASKPGIRLDIVKHAKKIQKFSSQFKPYMGLFGADFQKTFDGTLFRLPLRTKKQADSSLISKTVYSREEVMSLFHLLSKGADNLLLFTQNVGKVVVYTIDKEHTEVHKISMNHLEKHFSIERSIAKVLKPIASDSNIGTFGPEPQILCHATTILENRTKLEEKNYCNGYIVKVTSAGNLPGHPAKTDESHWVVVGNIGKDKTRRFYHDDNSLLPVGGAAAKLKYDIPTNKYLMDVLDDNQAKVFCFLPLPISSNLPVHINGYFAITSNRSHLHTKEDNQEEEKGPDIRSQWNEALMEDAVCPAYLQIINMFIQHDCFDQEHFRANIFDLFPSDICETVEGRTNPIFLLMQEFFKHAFTGSRYKLLPWRNAWTNGENFKSLDRYAKELFGEPRYLHAIGEILHKQRMHFVDIPFTVYNALEKCSLIDILRINLVSCEEFYDILLPNIAETDQDGALDFIYCALTQLNGKLDLLLREAKCIPVKTQGKSFAKPSSLVDPDCNLADLFDREEGVFPLPLLQETDPSRKDNWRRGLRRLGMKRDNLTPEEIIERAKTIRTADQETATKRYDRLLDILHPQKDEHSKDFYEALKNIKFLPKMKKPFWWEMPWAGDEYGQYLTLNDFYDTDDYSFLGTVLPIIQTKRKLRDIAKSAGVVSRIDIPTVLDQLSEVAHTLRDTTVNTNIEEVVTDCYDWFEKHCSEYADDVHRRLKNDPVILITDTNEMVKPGSCVLNLSRDCKPHFYKFPLRYYRQYPKLSKALQIPERSRLDDFIAVLEGLFQKNKTVALNDEQLLPVLNIIETLADSISSLKEEDRSIYCEKIYIPNGKGVLRPSTELSVNTSGWIPMADSSKMCHKRISLDVALKLGAKNIEEQLLRDCEVGIAFGQHQNVTSRIRNILEGYPFDETILKEMLQNADDAGASEIQFVLDDRYHATTKLFNKTWEHLQGPALLVYNNRCFTQQDIEGIQNLGEGGKQDNPLTTGKYGVGFNCVYNLTDTPTFFTSGANIGQQLCALDPQCKYIPGASETKPGRMFQVKEDLENTFRDVFSAYDIPLEKGSEYTLFRLPLRSQEVARSSEFANRPVTTTDIAQLFDSFQNIMTDSLLFLLNVRKITLSKIDSAGNLSVICETMAEISKEGEEKVTQYKSSLHKAAALIKSGRYQIKDLKSLSECVYEMKIHSAKEKERVMVICQRLDGRSTSLDNFGKRYDINRCPLPKGGVAFCPNDFENLEKPEKGYLNKDSRVFCTLPIPKPNGLPMHVNGAFIMDSENRHDFCKLEGFGTEWNRFILKEIVAEAFISVIKEMKSKIPTCPAQYEDIKCSLKTFVDALPNAESKDLEDDMQYLQNSIYLSIVDSRLVLFPVLVRQQWTLDPANDFPKKEIVSVMWKHAPTDAQQLYFETSKEAKYSSKIEATTLRNVLLNCKFPYTCLPLGIQKRVNEAVELKSNSKQSEHLAECEEKLMQIVSPVAVLKYLKCLKENVKSINLPWRVDQTPFITPEAVKVVFQYVEKANEFERSTDGLPLLLTHDGILRQFHSSTITFGTAYPDLVPSMAHRFLHQELYKLSSNDKTKFPHTKEMDIDDFSYLIEYFLDKGIYFRKERATLDNEGMQEWLSRLYSFLYSKCVVTGASKEDLTREKTEFLKEKLKPLSEWCIVPIIDNQQTYLGCLRDSKFIFTEETFKQLPALSSLPLPKVAFQDQDKEMIAVLKEITANTKNPFKLLQALVKHLTPYNLTDTFSKESARNILGFFCSQIHRIKGKPDVALLLKRLPLHVTIFGELTAAGVHSHLIVVPQKVPKNGLRIISSKGPFVLIESNKSLEELYRTTEAKCLPTVQLYLKFILPIIQQMDPRDIYAHVLNIKQRMEKKGKDTTKILCEKLKDVRFLAKEDGTLCRACDLFDDNNDVFKEMQCEDDFPQCDYSGDAWRPFLLELGLVSEANMNMIINYACQISAGGFDAEKTEKSCRVIIKYMFDKFPTGTTKSQSLSGIKFLPRKPISPDLLSIAQPVTQTKLVSFAESTVEKYERITWTVHPCLLEWEVPPRESLRDGLSIIQKPKIDEVLKHLENIGSACHWSMTDKTRKEIESVQAVLVDCIEYLKESAEETDIKRISSIRFILNDDGRFYQPSQAVLSIGLEWQGIGRYLCQLPSCYDKLVPFLKKMDFTNEIVLAQVVSMLSTLYRESKGKTLSPNGIIAALNATKLLFSFLSKLADDASITELYLPTTEHTMVSADEVCLHDSPEFRNRNLNTTMFILVALDEEQEGSKVVININVQKQALENLPYGVKPKLLSSIAREHIDKSCLKMGIDSRGPIAVAMREKLNSEMLCLCILRLIRNDSTEAYNANDDRKLMEEIKTTFKSFTCVQIKSLKTYLVEGDKKVENSEKDKHFFISSVPSVNDDTKEYTIYLTSEADINGFVFCRDLSNTILQSSKLFSESKSLKEHFPNLLREKQENMQSFLKELKISGQASRSSSGTDIPKPGDFVPQQYIGILDQTIVRLSKGEFVALEINDPILSDDEQGEDSLIYIYAKIIDYVLENEDITKLSPMRYKYKIDVGKGKERIVSAEMLYRLQEHAVVRDESTALLVSTEAASSGTHSQEYTSKDHTPTDAKDEGPQTLDEIKAYIDQCLIEAWETGDEQLKRKVFKRLALKFHPDKNAHRADIATEAFKYLQNQIDILEKGGDIRKGKESKKENSTGSSWFRDNFENFSERANRHRRQRDQFRGFFNFNDFNRSSGTSDHHKANPQPGLARRWMQQAKYDLAAVVRDTTGDALCDIPYEWACYKCHQAAKKATRAAQYSVDASYNNPTYTTLEECGCYDLESKLRQTVGSEDAMQYPDQLSNCGVPRDRFSEDQTSEALALASEIVEKCEEFMYN